MGGGDVWTDERRARVVCPFMANGQRFKSAYDRSSAHFAAWHSPKRDDAVWGLPFKLPDCRVWMRLHFWAMREARLFEPPHAAFADYYVRFIAHFVSVYERTAPPFTRESARWSADAGRTSDYTRRGAMDASVSAPLAGALMQLPPAEREYTGSSAGVKAWPYEV